MLAVAVWHCKRTVMLPVFRASHAMEDCLFFIKYKPGTDIHYVMTNSTIQKVHLLQSVCV